MIVDHHDNHDKKNDDHDEKNDHDDEKHDDHDIWILMIREASKSQWC